MRKLQMFRAMIAAAILCIAGTGAAEADCSVTNLIATFPASFEFNAAKPNVTQYEYKLGFTPVGCNANYSVELFLWAADIRSKGFAVQLPDKSQVGGYFSTANPVDKVPVAASLTLATGAQSGFSQAVHGDGSSGSISMYYNVDPGTNYGLFKPGAYTGVVNVAVYIRNNLTNVAVPTTFNFPMTVRINISPTAWLDHFNDKLDFGELALGGVTKDAVYIYAYTNVQYALSFHSDNGWLLKASPKDTAGVKYGLNFDPVNLDPKSANDPRAFFNMGGGNIGLQGPSIKATITSDPTGLPAGTYSDILTITLDIRT